MVISPVSAYTDPELKALLPSSYEVGVIPRAFLVPGERVLFETRPSLAARYWGRIAFLAFWGFLFVLGSFGVPGGLDVTALVFGVIILLLIAYPVLQWRRSAYGITDQRILRVDGVREQDLMAATYDQVQSLSRISGSYGGLRFELFGPTPTGWWASHKGRRIDWDSLRESPQVYQFVQTAFARHFHAAAPPTSTTPSAPSVPASAPYPMAATSPPAPRYPGPAASPPPPRTPYYPRSPPGGAMRCPACGYPVDTSKVNPALPQCPRCLFLLPVQR
jgi:hypothetical protein